MPKDKEHTSLNHIKVEGFKSILKLDLEMKNINILIGANGAGKSNFISIFTFLDHLSQGKLQHYVQTEGGAERFFHFGTPHTEQIDIDLEVSPKFSYHVEFSPNKEDDTLVFAKEYCIWISMQKKGILIPRRGESGLSSGSPLSTIQQTTKNYLESYKVYHFHDTSPHAKFKKTNKLISYHYLERDAGNIAPFLYYLKNSDQAEYNNAYNQIITTIKTIAPFFHDFYLEPTGREDDENILLRWTHTEQENPFSANALSDGTARFICLATLLLQPKDLRPATVIIDEPELGLHPAALTVLADIIKSIAKDTQVICSTQSVTFANHFQPEDFIVVDAKDGISTFHRPEKEKLKDWLEDYRMGDIWDKNLIGGRPAW